MRITIRQKNIKITPALETYIEVKLFKPLRRLLKSAVIEEPSILDLEISRTTRHHRKGKVWRANMVMTLPKEKESLYAEVVDEDIHTAIDILAEEIEREIKKYKGKSRSRSRRSARSIKRATRFDPAAQFPKGSRVREEGN